MEKIKTYTKKERNYYLISMFGQNVIYNIIAAGLSYYLQFTILIPAIAVTTIMTIARVWDAFNDPMMGTIVDKTRSKDGKCIPFLKAVPIPIFIITCLCFTSIGFYDSSAGASAKNVIMIIWAAFTYILWGMTYTVGDIPLWGLPALMTESEKDRNQLLSLARIVAGIGGGLSMLAIQPLALFFGGVIGEKIGDPANGERWGFLLSAFLFALIGCGLFQFLGFKVKEKIPPSKKKYTLKQNFTLMWTNKPFRQILLSGVFGSAKMIAGIVSLPLVTYYFADKSPLKSMLYLVLLGGGMFIGQFIAMALVPKFLKKYSKKNLYNASNLLGVIPYLSIFLFYMIAPNRDVTGVFYVILCFIAFGIIGFSGGIPTVLQSLMIADAIDYEEYHNGTRPDGAFFAGQTFIVKLSTGLATIMSGIGYTVVNFSDSEIARVNEYIANGGIARENPEFAPYMMILFFLISIPPAIGCILSVIPTWKYCLSDEEHTRIMNELNKRRAQVETELSIKTSAVNNTDMLVNTENVDVNENDSGLIEDLTDIDDSIDGGNISQKIDDK